jgi:hypothetical protein
MLRAWLLEHLPNATERLVKKKSQIRDLVAMLANENQIQWKMVTKSRFIIYAISHRKAATNACQDQISATSRKSNICVERYYFNWSKWTGLSQRV